MTFRTISSRELRQNWGFFKSIAVSTPVVITTRARPMFVLLPWLEYKRLLDAQPGTVNMLATAEGAAVDSRSEQAADSAKPADPE
jgi:PHD/YefM family antitoxin component YafN of YafNO toxin-antitoxin module